MRYNTIKYNDVANAPGICVSVYLQGCPHHCFNCFNQETWNFSGGQEFTNDTLESIIHGLTANGIKRSLAILGGEPLDERNAFLTQLILEQVQKRVPGTKIYIWTGFIYEDLMKSQNPHIKYILEHADVLIDGPFIQEERDITLPMRGSRNQRIIPLK